MSIYKQSPQNFKNIPPVTRQTKVYNPILSHWKVEEIPKGCKKEIVELYYILLDKFEVKFKGEIAFGSHKSRIKKLFHMQREVESFVANKNIQDIVVRRDYFTVVVREKPAVMVVDEPGKMALVDKFVNKK